MRYDSGSQASLEVRFLTTSGAWLTGQICRCDMFAN